MATKTNTSLHSLRYRRIKYFWVRVASPETLTNLTSYQHWSVARFGNVNLYYHLTYTLFGWNDESIDTKEKSKWFNTCFYYYVYMQSTSWDNGPLTINTEKIAIWSPLMDIGEPNMKPNVRHWWAQYEAQ